MQGVVDQVNEQQPDLIILGGDLADGTIEFVGEDLAPSLSSMPRSVSME